MNDLVSVIVPAYNMENYLERCLESLINQTYEHKEIIIIDDGSTDRTSQICDYYARSNSCIRVIHQKNKGLSAARNTGIREAKGEYLCFVDADDYVSSHYVSCLYSGAVDNDADVVMCDYLQVIEGEKKRETEKQENDLRGKGCYLYTKDEIYEILCDVCHGDGVKMVIACNKIYKKEIFDEIRYPEGVIHEDEYVIHRIIEKAKKVGYIDLKLYFYCCRDGSITRDGATYNVKHLDILDAFKNRVMHYREYLSREKYKKMILAYCEMITVQYRIVLQSNNNNICMELPDCNMKVLKWLKYQMKLALKEYREEMTLRKWGKYKLFIIWPGLYYKYFW